CSGQHSSAEPSTAPSADNRSSPTSGSGTPSVCKASNCSCGNVLNSKTVCHAVVSCASFCSSLPTVAALGCDCQLCQTPSRLPSATLWRVAIEKPGRNCN